MRKYIFIVLSVLFSLNTLHAQYINRDAYTQWMGRMGIGKTSGTPADANAWLELGESGTGKSLILPRLNGNATISTPREGMFHYDLGTKKLYYYNGTSWMSVMDNSYVPPPSFTNADFDTRFATKTTDNLAQGITNLYWSQSLFNTALSAKTTDNLTEGVTNLYWTPARFDARFATKTTDNLAEGSANLYFTNARAQAALAGSYIQNQTASVQAGGFNVNGTGYVSKLIAGTASSFGPINGVQFGSSGGFYTSNGASGEGTIYNYRNIYLRQRDALTAWISNLGIQSSDKANFEANGNSGIVNAFSVLPNGVSVYDGTEFTINNNGVLKHRQLATDPSSPLNGQVYYNTTSNAFKGYINGAWYPFIYTAGQGLTNNNGALELGGTLTKSTFIYYGSSSANNLRLGSGFEGQSFPSVVGYEWGMGGFKARYNNGGASPVTPVNFYISATTKGLTDAANYPAPIGSYTSNTGAPVRMVEGTAWYGSANSQYNIGGYFASIMPNFGGTGNVAHGIESVAYMKGLSPTLLNNAKGITVYTASNVTNASAVNYGIYVKSVRIDSANAVQPYAFYGDSGWLFQREPAQFGNTVALGSLAIDPTGSNGQVYYNSTSNTVKAYLNGAWRTIISNAAISNKLIPFGDVNSNLQTNAGFNFDATQTYSLSVPNGIAVNGYGYFSPNGNPLYLSHATLNGVDYAAIIASGGGNGLALLTSSTVRGGILANGEWLIGNSSASAGNYNVEIGGKTKFNGVIQSLSGIGVGTEFGPVMSAQANSDAMTGVLVDPTFSDGAFTGVTHTALKVAGDTKSTRFVKTLQTTVTAVATTNIDLSLGEVIPVTLSASITTLNLNNPAIGAYIIKLTQDATGGRTVTWPASVKWSGGTAPTLSAANKTDIITLTYDGTNLYGSYQLNY